MIKLTEDRFLDLGLREYKKYDLVCDEMEKNQILQALQEYHKLNIVNAELRDDLETMLYINSKLKAENEELKKPSCPYCGKKLKLSSFQIDIGTNGDTYTMCDCGIEQEINQLKEEKEQFLALIVKIQSENNQLKQLKQRVESIDLSFLIQMMWSNYSIQKIEVYKEIAEKLQKLQPLLKDK